MQDYIKTDIATLKKYLLGELSSAESEKIDLEIISDEVTEEKLLLAENELVEDYLDETLSAAENEAFRKNFLVSPERIALLDQTALIKLYAQNRAAEENREQMEKSFAFAPKKRLFPFRWQPVALASLIIVGICFGAIFYFTVPPRQTVLEKELTAINRKNLSDPAELTSFTSLNLTGEVFRSVNGNRRLTADKLTEKVFFRLALPIRAKQPDRYRVELFKDDEIILRLTEIPFYSNADGEEVRLLLPATVLNSGTYQIKLANEAAPQSVFTYNFAVE